MKLALTAIMLLALAAPAVAEPSCRFVTPDEKAAETAQRMKDYIDTQYEKALRRTPQGPLVGRR
jgi:hypothetical protein